VAELADATDLKTLVINPRKPCKSRSLGIAEKFLQSVCNLEN